MEQKPSSDWSVEGRLAISSEHKLRAENLPFDIDVWYPALKQFTFESHFLPLERSQCEAIINFYKTRNELKRDRDFNSADATILLTLKSRIDQLLSQHFQSGAFIRLCGRSLKDGEPFNPQSVQNLYQNHLQSLLTSLPPTPNTKLLAIAHTPYLRVTSADDAMNLLLTSERAYTDMIDWKHYGEPEQLVFRKWEPELSYDYEFRVFICNNKITAISQYDHYAVYKHLFEMKENIKNTIIEFWNKVHSSVGEHSYVMDVGYFPKRKECILIEVSPFLPCTGPALFNWKNDKEMLSNGPLEFRLNEVERSDLDQLLESNWELRWATPMERYDVLLNKVKPEKSFWNFLRNFSVSNELENKHLLFFYGTLKKGFHWNQKFLSRSELVRTAKTLDCYPLVVGQSGVPYLLGDLPGKGKQIIGEVWKVNEETLLGLDEYEGVSKGYYCRKTIKAVLMDGKEMEVDVYFKTESSDELRNSEYFEEYTLKYHLEHYKAIRHIQVKQLAYLNYEKNKT